MEMDKFWLVVYYDQFPESLRLRLVAADLHC
jgi:hypothetical protein